MRGRPLLYACLRLSVLLFFIQTNVFAQAIQVVDEQGQGLPGVNVSIDGIPKLSTDLEGRINLENESYQQISFSFLGFKELSLTSEELGALNFVVKLKSVDELLDEIIVVGRTNSRAEEMPFRIESISAKEIARSESQTSADALAKSGNVYVQRSQMGGGSPVIRGFEANKILLVVDGVRMNNAIYRGGHLQNAITIDPAVLNRAELIFGPGSLLYGSDALGGVIHFRTLNPIIDAQDSKGLASVRFATANKERSIHGHISYTNGKNLAALTSISTAIFSDLRTGSNRDKAYPNWGQRPNNVIQDDDGEDTVKKNPDPNLQIGTAYSQFDLLQKVVYKPVKDVKLGLNIQYSTSTDIPRYDFLTEVSDGLPRYAEWSYGPQVRLLASPNIELTKKTKAYDRAMFNVSYQRIEELRKTRNYGEEWFQRQFEDLNVFGSNIDFKKEINKKVNLEYGGSYYLNLLSSEAFEMNKQGTRRDFLTRYPSNGSTLHQAGIYGNLRLDLVEDLLLWNVGLRASNQTTNFSFSESDPIIWPSYYYDNIKNSNSSLVWMTGLNFNSKPWEIKLLAGSSFRAPNVDDLAKVRVKSDEITVPNPELIPEKVLNGELNIAYRSEKLSLGASAFYSKITDIVVRRDFTLPDGSPIYVLGNDTLIVTANTNDQRGIVYGVSALAKYEITKRLSFSGSINQTVGKSINSEEVETPLDHIPPLYGKVELRYETKKFESAVNILYNGFKPIEEYGGSADNPEYALDIGTPAWQSLNLYNSYIFSDHWKLNFAVENILDQHYRPFASGVSAPGRNFIISINYSW